MRVPLPAKDLFTLPRGAAFVVYWAKDDDPQDVRLNYKRQEIAKTDGDLILTRDHYEWYRSEIVDPERNELDTSRGIARFFRAD